MLEQMNDINLTIVIRKMGCVKLPAVTASNKASTLASSSGEASTAANLAGIVLLRLTNCMTES